MSSTSQAKKDSRAEFVTRLFVVVLLVVVAVLTVTITQIRSTQLEGTPTGKKLVRSADRILDCTDPDGQCYKDGQERTAQVVGDIGAGNVLAVVCALQVPNGTPLQQALDEVTECVADRLAERAKTP